MGVVIRLPRGRVYGGVGRTPEEAKIRATVQMLRAGEHPRDHAGCEVEEYRFKNREIYRDEYMVEHYEWEG